MALAPPDEAKCAKYAQFASHLGRPQFKIIYWTMFMTNLMLLSIAANLYMKCHDLQQRMVFEPRKRKSRLRVYIVFCAICAALSAVVTVMEAYALLALQFCDGEDLISLYWSTWTMVQVGSLIAIIGIILALMHTLKDRQHPPWALALGTPVLVIAGFLYLIPGFIATQFKKLRRPSRVSQSKGDDPSGLESGSTGASDSENSEEAAVIGEFVGFNVEGGPIVRFQSASAIEYGPHMTLIGYSEGEKPMVSYRKNSIQFLSDHKEAAQVRGEERLD